MKGFHRFYQVSIVKNLIGKVQEKTWLLTWLWKRFSGLLEYKNTKIQKYKHTQKTKYKKNFKKIQKTKKIDKRIQKHKWRGNKFVSSLLIDQSSVQRADIGQKKARPNLDSFICKINICTNWSPPKCWHWRVFLNQQECDGDSDESRKLLQLTAAADTTVILQISHSINNRSTFIFPDEIQSHVIYRNCVIWQKMANKNPLCDYAHHI